MARTIGWRLLILVLLLHSTSVSSTTKIVRGDFGLPLRYRVELSIRLKVHHGLPAFGHSNGQGFRCFITASRTKLLAIFRQARFESKCGEPAQREHPARARVVLKLPASAARFRVGEGRSA